MSEDMIFSIHNAVLSNLDRLSELHGVLSEQRLLELCDIAHPMAEASISLLDDGLDGYEMLLAISENLTFGEYPISNDNTADNIDYVKKSIDMLGRVDKAFLTEIYTRFMADKGRPITENDFLPTSTGVETFTYVRNSLSDEAYDVFSQEFEDPKVRYSSSFKDCARAVADGEVTYCLLPLEERGGVRLPTVSDIIFRNDFKINSVIPVFGPDGNADMKYALVSKNFTASERDSDDDGYLEIRLGADSALSEILWAVDYFGMSIYRVNTATFDTEGENETYFSVVIKDGGCSFAPILTYFTLFIRDFIPVGIYKNLE